MSKKMIRNSKTARAVSYSSKSTGKIWVTFRRLPHTCIPGVRKCRPIICKDGTVGVRQYNGLWRLVATVDDRRNLGVSPSGRRYRAGLHFEAEHVLWFDEQGRKTDAQAQNELQIHAYRNRVSQFASSI